MKFGIKNKVWDKLIDAAEASAELIATFIKELQKRGVSDQLCTEAVASYAMFLVPVVNSEILTKEKEEQAKRLAERLSSFG
ncbi:MAG: hypothetical protein ACXQS8_06675 [Candidatus Helarchaeales archaeon]